MKKAFLSTTYRSYAAEKAVDGNDRNYMSIDNCASSNYEDKQFWYVDLGTQYDITHVQIFLYGSWYEAFHDVDVTVARSDKDFDIPCNTFKGTATPESQQVVLKCPQGTYGRYLKTQIMEGTRNVLTLCEVKVFGK
ncbi:hypothetical protein FSP39_023784 [Pinctada imbricata]|uniref:Fucolectin tachylectin-4 pentraxin-1 domain-containing protein n=1 Tax=Pinctada imbricata TaxID=66713 RepID=A0AA88YGA4_PINIB|nr:hypothetical protein FSP39_023784 [Pinctada imbricata]